MLKICPQCRDEFKTYRSAAIYCGRACQFASQVKPNPLQCAFCLQTFSRPPHNMKKNAKEVFCSYECHNNARLARAIHRPCAQCGIVFHAPTSAVKHCSATCADAGRVTAVFLACAECKSQFRAFAGAAKGGRKFCSVGCAQQANVGPNHVHYAGGRWLKHGRRWQKVRLAVLARDRTCLLCKAERSPGGRTLDVHHVQPRRDHLIVDIANEMTNLVALCAPCHSRVEWMVKHGRTAELPRRLRPRR